jgi:hypothetical protein
MSQSHSQQLRHIETRSIGRRPYETFVEHVADQCGLVVEVAHARTHPPLVLAALGRNRQSNDAIHL